MYTHRHTHLCSRYAHPCQRRWTSQAPCCSPGPRSGNTACAKPCQHLWPSQQSRRSYYTFHMHFLHFHHQLKHVQGHEQSHNWAEVGKLKICICLINPWQQATPTTQSPTNVGKFWNATWQNWECTYNGCSTDQAYSMVNIITKKWSTWKGKKRTPGKCCPNLEYGVSPWPLDAPAQDKINVLNWPIALQQCGWAECRIISHSERQLSNSCAQIPCTDMV